MTQLKRFFLFIMLLSHMLIKPVSSGENIWQINAFSCEESEETTSKICEIESKLDEIDLDFGDSIDSITDLLCSKLVELETCIPITQEDINAGFTISSPGKYCLVENVSHTSASTAITISSSNVTLDLNGHVIDGTNTATIGVSMTSVNDVIIKNGRIIDVTQNGLIINSSSRVCVTNVKSSQHTLAGFSINNSTHVIFDHCLAQSNSLEGFEITDSSYCVFRDCIANNNSVVGFLVDAVTSSITISSNTFIRCQANSNTSTGFISASPATGSSIVNTTLCKCIAIDNTTGFDFDAVSAFDSILISCKAVDNTTSFTGNSSTGAFNNFAKADTTSYSGISTPIMATPTTTTGYWTNLDQ